MQCVAGSVPVWGVMVCGTHAPKCVRARMDVCAPIHLYHFKKKLHSPPEGMMPVSKRVFWDERKAKFAALWESELLRVWPPH